MNDETVSHEGIVTRITDKEIVIQIISKSACAACHAKSACNLTDIAEKELIIPKPNDKKFSVNQKVNIKMSVSQGNKAVVYAYLIPIIVLFAVLFTLLGLEVAESLSAIISIGAICFYYLVLYFFRNKIKRTFQYEIE
jgi:Positive regulator of sigma E activity